MERELIAHLRDRLPNHPLLRLGIGDDAAVLDMATTDRAVMTVDVLTDGVDFLVDQIDPRLIGRKALAANLSDIAAMAAEPIACVVGLVLPREGGRELAVAIYEGLLPLAEEHGTAVAGGDTNAWDGPLAIGVTIIGRVTEHGPLTRSGAGPGDRLLVTGALGGSILERQFHFEPRVREALTLNARYDLHAGMDISDGLLLDASRLCAESGVGLELDLTSIPIADDARRLADKSNDGRTPLDHALSDGEDFELLLAVPDDVAEQILADRPIDAPITAIGRFTSSSGLVGVDANGRRNQLDAKGFHHEFD